MKRFTVITLGCKVNQYDGCAISAALERAGLEPARRSTPSRVELVVINTCCVTARAMQKSRQAIRRAVRRSPGAAVLVTGCYGDYDGARIARLLAALSLPPEKTFIAGHHEPLSEAIRQVVRTVSDPGDGPATQACGAPAEQLRDDESMNAGKFAACATTPASIRARRQAAVKKNLPAAGSGEPIRRFADRQRAFVKVQDGCDAFCSYCIVPYTRCRVRSRSVGEVVEECRLLVAAGHKEIVLCGVFLGAFGRKTALRRRWDDTPGKLPELLRRVAGIEGLWRVRLSSLEPGDLDDELLAAAAELPNFAPHLHLPLQSGSDDVLRRMNRQYAVADFRRATERLGETLDRPAITTDIIVGFPGEGEAEFAETLDAVRDAGLAKIHAFRFSAIEGTAAWEYRDEAPAPGIVRDRLERLSQLGRRTATAYRRQFVGEMLEALVESPRRSDGETVRRAMTDRYITVRFRRPGEAESGELTGRVVRLKITDVTDEGLAGELTEPG